MNDSFVLEGVTYRQEYRRCGKPTCKTCSDAGDGHGPYWYSHGQVSGVRKYIGKELPPAVTAARQALAAQTKELHLQRDRLVQQSRALDALLHRCHLSSAERDLLTWMGFADCLVQPGGHGRPQDAQRSTSNLLIDIL